MKKIKAKGVKVNEFKDKSGFQKAVSPIVDKYDKETGHNLVDKVRAVAN